MSANLIKAGGTWSPSQAHGPMFHSPRSCWAALITLTRSTPRQRTARQHPPLIVYAAVAHPHAIDNGVSQRSTALDDSPAHALDVIVGEPTCQCVSVDVGRSPHWSKAYRLQRQPSFDRHTCRSIAEQCKLG